MTSTKVPVLHPETWAMDIVEGEEVSQTSACIILCGSWAVWTERNAHTHGESTRSIAQSVKWAIDVTTDLSVTGSQQAVRTIKEHQTWKPPEESFIKINVDAAFCEETHEGGTGMGVRNYEGNLLKAQSI